MPLETRSSHDYEENAIYFLINATFAFRVAIAPSLGEAWKQGFVDASQNKWGPCSDELESQVYTLGWNTFRECAYLYDNETDIRAEVHTIREVYRVQDLYSIPRMDYQDLACETDELNRNPNVGGIYGGPYMESIFMLPTGGWAVQISSSSFNSSWNYINHHTKLPFFSRQNAHDFMSERIKEMNTPE